MFKKYLIYPVLVIGFGACVSQSDYDKLQLEKLSAVQECDKLKQEIQNIKYDAPTLLSDGKQFYEAKNFTQARAKFQTLVEKHPDKPQSIEANKYLQDLDEEDLWTTASITEYPMIVEKYISSYPKGKYTPQAEQRLRDLKISAMSKSYEAAGNQNTSGAWERFLEAYPDYEHANMIREKIIRLKVDEIAGARNTGQIPVYNQYSSERSAYSTISITNNTGCDLEVLYSGPAAESITIPANALRTVHLSSGNYRIAASACGDNYAGTEDLHGSYNSTFFIKTTRF